MCLVCDDPGGLDQPRPKNVEIPEGCHRTQDQHDQGIARWRDLGHRPLPEGGDQEQADGGVEKGGRIGLETEDVAAF